MLEVSSSALAVDDVMLFPVADEIGTFLGKLADQTLQRWLLQSGPAVGPELGDDAACPYFPID